MIKENLIKLLEDKSEDSKEILNLLFVTLISSDNCWTEEDCLENLKQLEEFEAALNECNISEELKKEWQKRITMGYSIIDRDIDMIRTGVSSC